MTNNDFKKIKNWFNEYVSGFFTGDNKFDSNILLKKEHSLLVVDNAVEIAKSVSIKGKDLFLVKACALLHDIGRFEQFRLYQTFEDKKSENHGELGKRIIEKTGSLSFLDTQTIEIIKKTVRYHNAYCIPDFIDAKTRLFLEIICDADKIDIFRVISAYYDKNNTSKDKTLFFNLPDSEYISNKVFSSSAILGMGFFVQKNKLKSGHLCTLLHKSKSRHNYQYMLLFPAWLPGIKDQKRTSDSLL